MEKLSVPIYGISVSKRNMRDTVAYLMQAVESRRPHQVITANPIMVMAALESKPFMDVMRNAELVVPDGAGLVWATEYIGNPVPERVAGYDLVFELMKEADAQHWRIFLLGAEPDIVRQTAEKLQRDFPGAVLAGYRDGFFTDQDDEEVISQITDAKPDILFVARATNNQEPWIGRYKHRLNVPVMMGVGGTFDGIAGKVKRAPKLFQQLRLEWFYRLLQEPTRYRRMLALPKFVWKVIRDKENVQKPPQSP